MDNIKLKAMIASSSTVEEANRIIEEHTNLKTYAEKQTYIEEMFECTAIDIHELVFKQHITDIIARFKNF